MIVGSQARCLTGCGVFGRRPSASATAGTEPGRY